MRQNAWLSKGFECRRSTNLIAVGVGAVFRFRFGLAASLLCLPFEHLPLLSSADPILDGHGIVGPRLAEPLEVEMLNELPERHLPGFLAVVVDLSELLWIHPQLASHLDMTVGQVVAPSRIDPSLHLLIRFLLLVAHWLYFISHSAALCRFRSIGSFSLGDTGRQQADKKNNELGVMNHITTSHLNDGCDARCHS